ncbi:unnamed protein product [Moneuplotes crassus]|uniref:Uncharacterized protein n=1 Tax=Euplotes crassus TaxID=5936 RepID=A0AAD1XFQ1_EUPCR|nr:unnamed protein product [Moneuplotes crassus]
MEMEIEKFKKSLQYKYDGFNKILSTIQTDTQGPDTNNEIISQIYEAFDKIKQKIDYIANQRVKEIRNLNNSLNFPSSNRSLIARYKQFQTECVNQLAFLNSYFSSHNYMSFYMRKSDFEYTKDKIQQYSEELTYLKNNKEFDYGLNTSIYNLDINMLEVTLSKISKNLKSSSLKSKKTSTTMPHFSTYKKIAKITKTPKPFRNLPSKATPFKTEEIHLPTLKSSHITPSPRPGNNRQQDLCQIPSRLNKDLDFSSDHGGTGT